MPELPEVETIARSLRRTAVGLRVEAVRLLWPKLLRGPAAGLRRLRGRRIVGVGRRGKMLLVSFEGDAHLLFHLKMTGRFHWMDRGAPVDRHTRLRIAFRDRARELRFSDVRKFAVLRLLDTPHPLESPALAGLGPEPLATPAPDLARRLVRRNGRLKSLLLNQAFLAGVGNIYADESLFAAGLHPLRAASSLSDDEALRLARAVQKILAAAVAAGGSTIRDYRDAEGMDGLFQRDHKVYGRRSEPCRVCGRPVERRVIGGRSSFFCPICQPLRPSGAAGRGHGRTSGSASLRGNGVRRRRSN